MKIELDKYYTPIGLATYCVELSSSVIGKQNITDVIEPSAGDGSFIIPIEKNFDCNKSYYDIKPEHESIIQHDFLTLDESYKKGRLIIGNPPFGRRNSLIVKFFKYAIKLGDYVAFILPISQVNGSTQLYEFDLICSIDLGMMSYSGVDLHCCFNIYKRPDSGKFNSKPKQIQVDGLEVIEYRRDKEDSYRKKIKDGYFLGIGSWGNGSVGKETEYVGQYAMELYFYSDDQYIIELVRGIEWKSEINNVSMKKLPKGRALDIINKYILLDEMKGE